MSKAAFKAYERAIFSLLSRIYPSIHRHMRRAHREKEKGSTEIVDFDTEA